MINLYFIILNMNRIWNSISNLGIGPQDSHPGKRTIILTNRLNFLMLLSMVFLLFVLLVLRFSENYELYYGTLRVLYLLIFNILIIILARAGLTTLTWLSVIFLPPVIFLLGPVIMKGYVEEEGFIYNPYVLISASILPQLLVHPGKQKFLYWFSLTYYITLAVSVYWIMKFFSGPGAEMDFPIITRIEGFLEFYIVAIIAIFIFVNASIHYLRTLNFRYEGELEQKNISLDIKNRELIRQKEEIEQHKDELVKREIITGRKLVGIISHEIVNSAIPITNLAGLSSQMLEDESGNTLDPRTIEKEVVNDIHYSLKIIQSRTQALVNFVNATKSLTNIPAPNKRTFMVRDLFERVAVLYKGRFNEAGIDFKTHIDPPRLEIDADLEMIEQVLINLILNALEAMGKVKDPRIVLSATMNGSGQKVICVDDNGTGISKDNIEQIFLPYYSTKSNNSGIGLSVSQQIIMAHHGRLEVESEPGKGSSFRIQL
jgi:signal transduction histidine kinase